MQACYSSWSHSKLSLPNESSVFTAELPTTQPSVRIRILIIKLSFLLKVIRGDLSLSARVFRSLAASDVASLIIIRQCHFLESTLNSNFTSTILTSSEDISLPSMKKEILQLDLSLYTAVQCCLSEICTSCCFQSRGKLVEDMGFGSRERSFWYHLHPSCTEDSLHSLSDNTCPVPNCSFTLCSESPCAHFLSAHTNLNISLVEVCVYCSDSLFMYGKSLYSLVSPPLFSTQAPGQLLLRRAPLRYTAVLILCCWSLGL